MNLTVHVGLFKTATTYLQRDVFPNMRGVAYVCDTEYRTTLLREFMYTDSCAFVHRVAAMRGKFDELMAGAENVVLSHELMSGNPYHQSLTRADYAAKLHQLFPEAKVILGLRAQQTIIDSLYREYVVQGGTKSFEAFVYNPGKLPRSLLDYDPHLDLEAFKYHSYAKRLAELFGKDRCFIFAYEWLKHDIDGFLGALLEFIGADPTQRDFTSNNRREGLGDFQLAVLRRVNRLYRSAFYKHGLIPYRYNISNLLRFTNKLWPARRSFTEGLGLQDFYAEDNDRLDVEFGLGLRERYAQAWYGGNHGKTG